MTRRLSDTPAVPPHADEAQLLDECLARLRGALIGLKYGSAFLTVHEGRIVQIDVTEKLRLKPH